ncbi:MAG: DUF4314 domain-containing protein [Lawsonibacter sp.]|nr:DUF4314 domain-containing protein [Lawsonibacter sp.]
MRLPDRETIAQMREVYRPGTRVELLRMDDPQAPPIGTRGTVRGVDDSGSVMVAWDGGGSLHVLYGVDECRKVVE